MTRCDATLLVHGHLEPSVHIDLSDCFNLNRGLGQRSKDVAILWPLNKIQVFKSLCTNWIFIASSQVKCLNGMSWAGKKIKWLLNFSSSKKLNWKLWPFWVPSLYMQWFMVSCPNDMCGTVIQNGIFGLLIFGGEILFRNRIFAYHWNS